MGRILHNIELSQKEYGDLLFKKGIRGGEANLVKDGNYIIKVFNKNFGHKGYSPDSDRIEEIRENKFRKIESVFNFKDNLLDEIKPISTYSVNGKFVAYKMPYLAYPMMSDDCFTREEKIYYLDKLKESLLRLHDQETVYGDIKGNNFFVNTSNGLVIPGDLDNMQIGDCPIDLMNGFAQEFVDNYGCVDEKLDSYMHNLYTLEIAMDCNMFGYIEVFDRISMDDIPDGINKEEVRELLDIDPSYDGGYLIDEIKRSR